MFSRQDQLHVKRCLELARQAEGRTAPNPAVGAVVIDAGGLVVGEGYHERAGLPHAEVVALDKAGDRAHGGTLYVNLEPCSHWGKTPPCAERVAKSGLARVVTGMVDPNPAVSGAGLERLRQAGLVVDVGCLEADCRWLNRGFIKKMERGLPWVVLKLASTLDGKIADRTGTSRWISGAEARHYVHQLRDKLDCVLIGAATAVRDDPQLNVRDLPGARDPQRAVVDPHLLVTPVARLCRSDTGGKLSLFCLGKSKERYASRYPEHVSLVPVPASRHNSERLDLSALLSLLADAGVLTVLCEGGARLSAGLLESQLVDELVWIVSPKLLPDAQAVPAIAPFGSMLLAQAYELRDVSIEPMGQDVVVRGVICR